MAKKEVTAYSQKTFESIKHIDENGAEFWLARELQIALEYAQWRRFQESVERAKTACEASGLDVADHFADVGKMIDLAKGAQREIADIKLSRYACYLIVMNGDPRKEVSIRITQTDDKLRRENIKGKEKANETHYAVGKKVRQTIAELGGTMPENLPTPEKSAKVLKKERTKGVAKK